MKNSLVHCNICQRRCAIADNHTGFCRTKINKNGKIYPLNYGLVSGLQVDPIEKKPLFHFLPGEMVPSIGSYGCNFRCKQCLNYAYSWSEEAYNVIARHSRSNLEITTPKQIIAEIKSAGFRGLAFTYNEPAIWSEFVLDLAKLAKKENFFTLFITNGSWTKETLDKIGPFLDAANIDFKGFSDKTCALQGAFFGEIPQMAKYAQDKYQIHLELTTLLIPGINDSPRELQNMFNWVAKNLGPKTPVHLSQFDPNLAPDPQFQKLPYTNAAQLKKAAKIGQKAGLQFIYIWAPFDFAQGKPNSYSNTVCPKCGTLVIRRTGWTLEILAVDKNGNCKKCKENLNIKLL